MLEVKVFFNILLVTFLHADVHRRLLRPLSFPVLVVFELFKVALELLLLFHMPLVAILPLLRDFDVPLFFGLDLLLFLTQIL